MPRYFNAFTKNTTAMSCFKMGGKCAFAQHKTAMSEEEHK